MKVAFYKQKNGNWLDFAINAMSGFGGYSHCEFVLDNNLPDYDYSNSKCFGISGRDKGVRYKNIDLTSGHWDIFNIIDSTLIDNHIEYQFKNYLNKKYDYFGIIFYWIFPIKWQNNKKWWCSELVANLLGIDNCRISPNELSRSIKLQKLL